MNRIDDWMLLLLMVLTVLGMGVSSWNLWDALGDRRVLATSGANGTKMLIANNQVYRGVLTIGMSLCLLIVAALQLTRTEPRSLDWQRVVSIGALIVAASLPLLAAELNFRSRRKLLK